MKPRNRNYVLTFNRKKFGEQAGAALVGSHWKLDGIEASELCLDYEIALTLRVAVCTACGNARDFGANEDRWQPCECQAPDARPVVIWGTRRTTVDQDALCDRLESAARQTIERGPENDRRVKWTLYVAEGKIHGFYRTSECGPCGRMLSPAGGLFAWCDEHGLMAHCYEHRSAAILPGDDPVKLAEMLLAYRVTPPASVAIGLPAEPSNPRTDVRAWVAPGVMS